jgi:hypothetical protein
MLLVGIDWAEAEHAACLLDATGAVRQRLKVPHTAAGVRRLQSAIAGQESQPGMVLVAIERPDGLLVDAMLDAGLPAVCAQPQARRAVQRPHACRKGQKRPG